MSRPRSWATLNYRWPLRVSFCRLQETINLLPGTAGKGVVYDEWS